MALIFSVLGSIIILNKIGLIGKNNRKSSKKTALQQSDEEINQYYTDKIRTMQEMHQEECKIYKKKIQSLTNTINSRSRFKEEIETEDEDDSMDNHDLSEKYELDMNKAKEYASKIGINPNGITDPDVLPLVWDKVKDNIDLALMLGIVRRRRRMAEITPVKQNSYQQDITSTAQTLINQGHYA